MGECGGGRGYLRGGGIGGKSVLMVPSLLTATHQSTTPPEP